MKFAWGILAAAFIATSAMAADDPMAGYYGNTVTCKAEGRYDCQKRYDKDGAVMEFTASIKDGAYYTVSGRVGNWRLAGEPGKYQMCVAWQGSQGEACGNFVPHKLGDTWQVKHTEGALKGVTEQFSLVEAKPIPVAPPGGGSDDLIASQYGNTMICGIEGLFECHSWVFPNHTFIQFSYDLRPGARGNSNVDYSGFQVLYGSWTIRNVKGKDFEWCRVFAGYQAPPSWNTAENRGEGWRCEKNTADRRIGQSWSILHGVDSVLAGKTEFFMMVPGVR